MERRILAVVFALLAYNYFFLSDSASHTKLGWIWLAVDVVLWLPELRRLPLLKK